ncbi:hypothetical protein Tco_0948920 [Tanacetum coccineum]
MDSPSRESQLLPVHSMGEMFSAAATAAISIVENVNATENIFCPSIGGRSFKPAAMILLRIWLSVEDVLTGVDMMNE